MAFSFSTKIEYMGGVAWASEVMVSDGGAVTEYHNGDPIPYESFKDWAEGAKPPLDELARLFPPAMRHELNNAEVVWDNMDPTHLKVGNRTFEVNPRARIRDTPAPPARRNRKSGEDSNQGTLF